MKYKIIALSLVLLGVVTMILVSCSNEKSAVSDVYDVIPDNSSLIISTSDIDSVSSLVSKDNALVAMLYSQKSELGMPICRVVDSLRDIDMFAGHLMQDAVVAVRKDGNSGLCQLYVCKTDAVDENSLAGLVDTLKHKGLESRIFNEIEILKCRLANSNSSVFVSFANGLALFSSSSRYMEDALQCLSGNGKRLKDDACFAKAFSAVRMRKAIKMQVILGFFVQIIKTKISSKKHLQFKKRCGIIIRAPKRRQKRPQKILKKLQKRG